MIDDEIDGTVAWAAGPSAAESGVAGMLRTNDDIVEPDDPPAEEGGWGS